MKNSKPLAAQGFSLIELMIVVAIMGILASLAIPQYNQYLHKAEFSELKLSVFPVKLAITECYDRNGDNSAVCNTSSTSLSVTSQVTDDMLETAAAPDSIDSLTVTAAGDDPKITVIPSASSSFSSTDTYELTGITAADSRGYRYIESWQESGGGCDKNLC